VVATQGAQPAGRWGHSAVVHNDRMYVYGGYGDTFLSDMYEYNFTTNMWAQVQTLGPKPKPRHFHAAVVYQDNMYMFGGFAGNKNTADMHKFHFGSSTYIAASSCFWYLVISTATSSWSPITQVAREAFVNRRGHSAVVHTNCIYVFGGRGDMHNLNDLVEYNIGPSPIMSPFWQSH
jgi:N-acetylneuraminic acid mutarotase